MTKAEVKAALPKHLVDISEKCNAWVDYSFEDGGLKQVEMTSSTKNSPDCQVIMLKSLATRYGESPRTSTQLSQGNCGGYNKVSNLCRALGGEAVVKSNFAEWVQGGVHITVQTQDGDDAWKVTYAPEPEPSPETVSKF